MAVTDKTISGNKCSGKWWVPPGLSFRSLWPVWGKRCQVLKDRWRLPALKRDGRTPSAVGPKASEFRCFGVPTRALEFCWEISNLFLQILLFWIPGWTASSHAEPLLLIVWHTCQTSRELLLGWFRGLPGSRAISSRKLFLNAHQAFSEDANFGERLRLQRSTKKPTLIQYKRPPRVLLLWCQANVYIWWSTIEKRNIKCILQGLHLQISNKCHFIRTSKAPAVRWGGHCKVVYVRLWLLRI